MYTYCRAVSIGAKGSAPHCGYTSFLLKPVTGGIFRCPRLGYNTQYSPDRRWFSGARDWAYYIQQHRSQGPFHLLGAAPPCPPAVLARAVVGRRLLPPTTPSLGGGIQRQNPHITGISPSPRLSHIISPRRGVLYITVFLTAGMHSTIVTAMLFVFPSSYLFAFQHKRLYHAPGYRSGCSHSGHRSYLQCAATEAAVPARYPACIVVTQYRFHKPFLQPFGRNTLHFAGYHNFCVHLSNTYVVLVLLQGLIHLSRPARPRVSQHSNYRPPPQAGFRFYRSSTCTPSTPSSTSK